MFSGCKQISVPLGFSRQPLNTKNCIFRLVNLQLCSWRSFQWLFIFSFVHLSKMNFFLLRFFYYFFFNFSELLISIFVCLNGYVNLENVIMTKTPWLWAIKVAFCLTLSDSGINNNKYLRFSCVLRSMNFNQPHTRRLIFQVFRKITLQVGLNLKSHVWAD